MKLRKQPLIALVGLLLAATGLSACAGTSSSGSAAKPSLVGFSILEQPNKSVFADFAKTEAGKSATSWTTSYGPSGDQSRAVAAGLKADVVHFSLESDITRLVDAGLVDENWKDTPTKGIATQSVVTLVVRKGNPKNIQGWDDLVKPGIKIITPNPSSSGSARWNILGAWGHVIANGGDENAAQEYLKKFFNNVAALPGSGREATTAFEAGNGDVLLSYENEAIAARAKGADFDYIVPKDTLLIENPAAVTKKAGKVAKAFLEYLVSKEGQKDYAEAGFRPLTDVGAVTVKGANDPASPFPQPTTLLTIDKDFGGWTEAAKKFFDEKDGIVTKIQAAAGKQ